MKTIALMAMAPILCFTADASEKEPQIGFTVTEVPASVRALRFTFSCPDDLSVQTTWVAQKVDSLAAGKILHTTAHSTNGPLTTTSLKRPANGWPLGLYRLEIDCEGKVIHVQHFLVVEEIAKR